MADRPGTVRDHWQDIRSLPLAEPEPLKPGELTAITAPAGRPGYLGLVPGSTLPALVLPYRTPGEGRDNGFALLPVAVKPQWVNPRSPFGMVHARMQDPDLTCWVKTMTWESTSPKWRAYEMEKRGSRELLELPIMEGHEWKTDDSQPTAARNWTSSGPESRNIYGASGDLVPGTRYREIPGRRFRMSHCWQSLVAKVRAVREWCGHAWRLSRRFPAETGSGWSAG